MKTSTIVTSALVLGLFSAFAAGCSAGASDGSDSNDSEGELRRKPKATENWSSLTVQLPTGSCQPGGTCSHPLGSTAAITLDGASIALGSANRIKPGDHTVGVNGVQTTINLVAGATRTFVLPTAHRKCTAGNLPTVAQTDFGASVSLSNAACPSTTSLVANSSGNSSKPTITLYHYNWGCPAGHEAGTLTGSSNASGCAAFGSERTYSANVNGTCVDLRATRSDGSYGINPTEACNLYVNGDATWATSGTVANQAQLNDYDLAFVPGEYTVALGNGSSTFKLKEGDTSEIALSLPVLGTVPSTFSTNISFADARELPDASVASITSNCSGDRAYAVPATTTTTQKLKAFTATNCVYTFAAGGRTVALSQTSTNNIKLQRLDVDNPEITRENGTTLTVTGTYELYFGGTRVTGPFPTNSGVDLLPGTYELVTSFSTADGPQVQRETLTL